MADFYTVAGITAIASQSELRAQLTARLADATGDPKTTIRLNAMKRMLWVSQVRKRYDERPPLRKEELPEGDEEFFQFHQQADGLLDVASFKAPLAVLFTRCDLLSKFSVLGALQGEVHQRLTKELPPQLVEWAVGAVLGMVIGDSFGSAVHGSPAVPEPKAKVFRLEGSTTLGLKPGQWTHIGASGLCLLDSVFVHNGFNAVDFLVRLFNWAHFGYNSSLAYDKDLPGRIPTSGVDEALGLALEELLESGSVNDAPINTPSSSSSSSAALSRVAPIAAGCFANESQAEGAACKQSLATRSSEVTTELCRLVCHLILKARQLSNDHNSAGDLLHQIDFVTDCEPVSDLIGCKGGWNWKSPDALKLSPERLGENPCRFGEDSLDCMFVALHCVWSTDTFRDALIMASSVGGQACPIGAVVGQLAGALYRLPGIPTEYIDGVQQWDKGGSIVLRAVLALEQQQPKVS